LKKTTPDLENEGMMEDEMLDLHCEPRAADGSDVVAE